MAKEKKLGTNEYRCDMCGKTYGKEISDKEAVSEKEELFGDMPMDDMAIVCDDCWNKLKDRFPELAR